MNLGWQQFIPFIMVSSTSRVVKLRTQRAIETIIIGITAGAFSSFITVKILENDIRHMQTTIKEIKSEIKIIRSDVYQPRFGK